MQHATFHGLALDCRFLRAIRICATFLLVCCVLALPGNRPAAAGQGAPSQRSSGTGPTGEVAQMRPAGVTTRPANTNSPLPL